MEERLGVEELLRAKTTQEIFQGKVPIKCRCCGKRLFKGDEIISCRQRKSNRVVARYCSDNCHQEDEHQVLSLCGYYADKDKNVYRPQHC